MNTHDYLYLGKGGGGGVFHGTGLSKYLYVKS